MDPQYHHTSTGLHDLVAIGLGRHAGRDTRVRATWICAACQSSSCIELRDHGFAGRHCRLSVDVVRIISPCGKLGEKREKDKRKEKFLGHMCLVRLVAASDPLEVK